MGVLLNGIFFPFYLTALANIREGLVGRRDHNSCVFCPGDRRTVFHIWRNSPRKCWWPGHYSSGRYGELAYYMELYLSFVIFCSVLLFGQFLSLVVFLFCCSAFLLWLCGFILCYSLFVICCFIFPLHCCLCHLLLCPPSLLPSSSYVAVSSSSIHCIFLLCCCVFLICPLIFLWFCVFLFCPLYLPPLLLCHPPTLLHLCLLSIFVSSSVAASSSSVSESSLDIAESLSSVDACFFLSCYIFHICCWIFPFCYYVLKSNSVHFSSTFMFAFSNLLFNVKYFDGLLQP